MEIPSHWHISKLSDVGEVVSGGTPSTKIEENFNGNIPWITPADLTGYNNKYISRGKRNISELGLRNSSAKLLPEGSILFSSRAPIGYVVISSNEISTNQGFKNLIPGPTVFNEFVYYYLKSAKNLANSYASGTTFRELSGRNFGKLPIPLPPLPEQHLIVQKIEELFSKLDNARANLLKARDLLKSYRQSVLKAAFEGRLTKGKIEFLPKKMVEVSEKVQDGSHFSPKNQSDQKLDGWYMYITSKNIRNNLLDFRKVKYVDKDFHNSIYPRCNPEFGDVLLTKDGVNTGNVTLNTIDEPFSLLSSVCLIKPHKDIVLPAFIKYYMQSPQGFKNITGAMSGTAIKRIILKKIKEATIPIPRLPDQESIVNEIESRLSVAENTEQNIEKGLEQIEALRQSILKAAFEGRLVKKQEHNKYT